MKPGSAKGQKVMRLIIPEEGEKTLDVRIWDGAKWLLLDSAEGAEGDRETRTENNPLGGP
jgi:hypothetical protein